ncbi:MAG: tetratricopeptide repeat protein [Acidobacteriota bacterium]
MKLKTTVRFILITTIALSITAPVIAQKPSQQNKKPQPQSPAPSAPSTGVQKPEPPKPATNDKQWALIVGISDYPGQIQDLLFPRDDAQSIRDLLVSSAGVRDDHIRLLTDAGEGELKATKQNIFAAIDNYLVPRVQTGDEVIVFLAGHGIARGLGPQAKSYFLPADVDAKDKESLERTGIDLAELARKLSALKANQFTVFVDACREDPFPGRGIKGNALTDVMARGLRIIPTQMQQTEPPTAIVFYSCKIGERAYENADLKHGVFTYFILRGIRDLAARPDGRVEAGMLAAYLRENVREWAAEYGQKIKYPVEQTPSMVATEVRGPMFVVRMTQVSDNLPPAPSTGAVTLIAPEGATISINGQTAGRGQVYKELAPSQYIIKAELPGFQPTETKVNIVAGYDQEIELALKPVSSSPSYEKGAQFESQGLWPQAVVSYELALREDPNLIPAYERLANAYMKAGQDREAMELLATATQKFPDNAALHARRSMALSAVARAEAIEEEDDDKSDKDKDKEKSKGKDKNKDKEKSKDKSDKGSMKDTRREALASAELAVQKGPDLALSHLAMGYALLLDKNTQSKALTSFVRASTIAPEDAESYYGVGYSYRLMTQYQQAVPQLKKAIELRPDYYDAQRELAYCYHALGQTDNAIRQYEVASSYRSESDSSEMAGNNLALSALYAEKGEQVGGREGEEYKKAGKGYETEAREYDPTLRVAMRSLAAAGVSNRIERHLPPEVRRVVDVLKVPSGGGIKIPIRKRP